MYTDESLKDMPLDVLLELFRKTVESLLLAKLRKEPDTTDIYQRILEQVQNAILAKRAEATILQK